MTSAPVHDADELDESKIRFVDVDYTDPAATIGPPLWNRLCEKNRDIELHVFNEAGHYSYREYAAEFNRLLVSFCSPQARSQR